MKKKIVIDVRIREEKWRNNQGKIQTRRRIIGAFRGEPIAGRGESDTHSTVIQFHQSKANSELGISLISFVLARKYLPKNCTHAYIVSRKSSICALICVTVLRVQLPRSPKIFVFYIFIIENSKSEKSRIIEEHEHIVHISTREYNYKRQFIFFS